ncbi:uncharacterized protein LOC106377337 [Brassica napus]|uniref:uncharacterized protein LOC106377337 n=1 Tax=Brassica napus TaxID=3708 RepID=UPI0020789D0A|nr:uncharacterized protein LOC106377337 [Brassica napus]
MGLMVTSPVSESLLLLPPPPEPPPSALPLDLFGGIPAPDPPDPPDPPDMFGESDLSSLPCLCFTLTAAKSHLFNCTTTACSVCLLLVPLRVKLVRHLLLPTAGCRSWIYDFVWGNDFSMFLSLFSKGILLLRKIGDGFKKANLGSLLSDLFVCPWWFLQLHTLLWLRISSQFQGSSKRCMITFVAKLLAVFYAFVAAACSGSSSPSVASDSRGIISPISTRGSLLSCLCVMFAYIYVYVTCFACDAAVSLASLALLYYLLNDYSFDGV